MASPTSLASTATTITTTAARLIAATPATVTSASPLFNVIFFLGPLLSLVFAVLAVSRRPRPNRIPSGHRSGNSPTTRRQAHIAYAYFALLALLSTLAGALPFIQAGTSTASKVEAVVQGLLSFSSSSSSSRIRRGLARSTSRRPITIHISTQRTSVPFSESTSSSSPTSPSSAISFQCPIAETEQQPGGAIELALPKRKHKDTRSRLIDTANRSVLYQDKVKRSAGCLGSDSNLIAINKHRHRYRQKKSSSTSTSSSIDSTSTTSTVTAFDQQQGRDFVANTPTSTTVTPGLRCSTPPLSSYPFIAPPRAAHTATSGTSLDTASIPLLAPARISNSHKRVYSLPLPIIDNNVSTSTDSTEGSPGIPLGVSSIVSVGDQPDLHLEDWGESCDRNVSSRISSSSRLAYSHTTRNLLVTLAAVQVVLIVGYACGLGENISPR
uniref:Uncharacterized protein n=1 Tax=Psilocybe cubensis TaxID=181762 RepID=A0A8H8CMW8_PSICU